MLKKIFNKFQKERDLTSGSISKNLWILAFPILTSNLMQAVFNLVDMFWVGRLGPVAIAAVAMCGSIMMIVMFVMMGIGAGTTAVVARAIGAKNKQKAEKAAMQSLILGFWTALFFSIIGYFLSAPILTALGADPAVVSIGTGYMQIIFLGVIVIVYMFLISAVLQGAGDAATPMLILVVSTLINIVLDPILIFGWLGFPKMGVNGAALATVIAEGIGSLIALEVLLNGRSRLQVHFSKIRSDLKTMFLILKIGMPASLQMTLRGLVGIALIYVVSKFGTTALAAYGIGMRLNMLALMPGFALAMAAGTLMGQNLGAKKPDRARASAWAAVFYYAAFLVVIGTWFVVFAPQVIAFFNNDPTVVAIGTSYFRITTWGYLFVAIGVVLSRALAGAADTVAPMIITFISLWLVQIPLAFILSDISKLGLNGVWFAILAAYIMQGVLTWIWFSTGRWKHKAV